MLNANDCLQAIWPSGQDGFSTGPDSARQATNLSGPVHAVNAAMAPRRARRDPDANPFPVAATMNQLEALCTQIEAMQRQLNGEQFLAVREKG
ncbi:hypothetical protein OWS73_10635 [Burkholderia sp. 1B3(2022)]|uniref:hypothetical protein n=1 Tax=unclassified Burkholderia TaxID=2613784 RepID=UPI00158C9F43|nr:hypothetical protein [Burkholderia sp. BCC0398]